MQGSSKEIMSLDPKKAKIPMFLKGHMQILGKEWVAGTRCRSVINARKHLSCVLESGCFSQQKHDVSTRELQEKYASVAQHAIARLLEFREVAAKSGTASARLHERLKRAVDDERLGVHTAQGHHEDEVSSTSSELVDVLGPKCKRPRAPPSDEEDDASWYHTREQTARAPKEDGDRDDDEKR